MSRHDRTSAEATPRDATACRAARHEARQRGSALVLVAVLTLVGALVVAAQVQVSISAARLPSDRAEQAKAYYNALAGVWASAGDIGRGGTGVVRGSVKEGRGYVAAAQNEVSGGEFELEVEEGAVELEVATSGGELEFALEEGAVALEVEGTVAGLTDPTAPPTTESAAPSLLTVSSLTGTFTVKATEVETRVYRIESTGESNGHRHRLVAYVAITREPSPFARAVFGDREVVLETSSLVDSFDSGVGTYDSHPDTAKGVKSRNGDVATNGALIGSNGAGVWGDLQYGSGGSVALGTAFHTSGVAGALEAPVSNSLPEWTVPATATAPVRVVTGDETLGPGAHVFSSLEISGRLTIAGGADDVVDIYLTSAAAALTVSGALLLRAGGPELRIHTAGRVVVTASGRLAAEAAPTQVLLRSRAVGPEAIRIGGGSRVNGAIYAPGGDAVLEAGSRLQGAVVAASVLLESNARVNYDEALGRAGTASTQGAGGQVRLLAVHDAK